MATCLKFGHVQPDNAKFCGLCGSIMSDGANASEVTVVVDVKTIDSSFALPDSTPQSIIELDLISDDDTDVDLGDDEAGFDSDDTDLDDYDTDALAWEAEVGDEDDEVLDVNVIAAASTGTTSNTVLNLASASQPAAPAPLFGVTVNPGAMKVLHDWAESWNELDDPYVKGLTEAVDRRDDLTMWASLDPFEMLPLNTPSNGRSILRIADIAAAIRNVLVFVPVLFTWLAIGKAVNAFGVFSDKYFQGLPPGTNESLNFLTFWQNPDAFMGGKIKGLLGDFWRIGDIAEFDAVLIGLIVFLTLVTGILKSFGESAQSKAEAIEVRDRTTVALAISKELHGKRQSTPESISESLAEALNDLTQAARDVNEGAGRLERATVGVEALNPQIEILNSHTQQLVAQTASQVTKAVNDLVASVHGLNSSVAGNITNVFSEAALTIEEVSKQLARTNASVEFGTKQLRDDLEAVSQQLQAVVKGGR